MTSINLRPDLSVVRIYKQQEHEVAGAGFLVSNEYILTCAHVVATALGINSDSSKMPSQEVKLDFPTIQSGELLTAAVEFWLPVNPDNSPEDIAILKLTTPPPTKARPAFLRTTNGEISGHEFEALGFPEGRSGGAWARGCIQGYVSGNWIQLVDNQNTGYRLEEGFSGTPIWDKNLGTVVGIAVAADKLRPEARAAFMIPTELLRQTSCQILGLNWQEIRKIDNVIDRFKIPREPQESICYETILQPGSLLRIKAPQYMGKTRMRNRVLNRFPNNDYQIVVVNSQNWLDVKDSNNLELISRELTAEETERHLMAFCVCVSYRLGLPDNILDECWHNNIGTPNHKTTVYFEERILRQINSPLILVLENVDRVFGHPLAQNFCNLLRGWHAEAQREELWQKLRLVIVHSTDVYASLDINSSPLANVGETVTLDEFTPQQVEDLVRQYGLDWNSDLIEQLMKLVGGHPYLINHALKAVVDRTIMLEKILATATTEEGIYRNYLGQLRENIKQQPTLKEALEKVVTTSHS
jgi:hypothetical protein